MTATAAGYARAYTFTPTNGNPCELVVRGGARSIHVSTCELNGTSIAREAAAWLLRRWRIARCRGASLRRTDYGPGWLVRTPWPERPIDPHIRRLVDAIDALPGVRTIGSCGGHEAPQAGQWPLGTWYVKFELTGSDKRALSLLRHLEFASWEAAGRPDTQRPDTPLVLLDEKADGRWALEGAGGADPDLAAERLHRLRERGR